MAERQRAQEEAARLVFSSEVLFPPGSADLSAGRQAQMARVAATLFEVADEIPQ